jgi:hypothetical protein
MSDLYTQGILIVDSRVYYTLELPWRDNQRNISCIPEGEYPIYTFSHSHLGPVIGLKDVPDRSEILIHPGNYIHESNGCILAGLNAGAGKVLNSRHALKDIVKYRTQDFITIENIVDKPWS